jgi:excisionase family DNA binding protein
MDTLPSRIEFPRLTYSIAESEVLTGLSRATLYRRIAAGDLRTVQSGRRRLVPVSELTRILSDDQSAKAD